MSELHYIADDLGDDGATSWLKLADVEIRTGLGQRLASEVAMDELDGMGHA